MQEILLQIFRMIHIKVYMFLMITMLKSKNTFVCFMILKMNWKNKTTCQCIFIAAGISISRQILMDISHLKWLKELEILDEYISNFESLTEKIERCQHRLEELSQEEPYKEKVHRYALLKEWIQLLRWLYTYNYLIMTVSQILRLLLLFWIYT